MSKQPEDTRAVAEWLGERLHDTIMNLPDRGSVAYTSAGERMAYKDGHRDARHAVAELVTSNDPADTIAALNQRVLEREAEIDRLQAAIAGKLDNEMLLKVLHIEGNTLAADFEGGLARVIAAHFAEVVAEAKNYVEMRFEGHKVGPLLVTVQRMNGKTPHALRMEAEAEVDRLRGALAQAEPLTWCACGDRFTAGEPGMCVNCRAALEPKLAKE